MDSIFFWVSKLLWALISPDSLLLLLLLCAYLLLLLGQRRTGRFLLGFSCLTVLLIALIPLGEWFYFPLEKRFETNPSLPESLDGIIVLGGFIETQRSDAWDQTQINNAAERLFAFQDLARQFPEAKLVFTGGNGSITGAIEENATKEASKLPALMMSLGLESRQIILESQSRNTWENVQLSKAMLTPSANERWLVVTSAFHMPRTIGIFCAHQWPVIPYPVDFRTDRESLIRLELRFAEHLLSLHEVSREWVGLVAYYFTGKTSQFLPSSTSNCTVGLGA